MKILSGISVVALLIAGAATPSFATSISPGTTVVPGAEAGGVTVLANTGITPFNFGGDTGQVQEYVVNFTGNPFGASDITFIYQIQVTGGDILNLTTESFNIAGIALDVGQAATLFPGFTGTLTASTGAGWTSDKSTVGFGFNPPDGLTPGQTSYVLIINTNLTSYEPGVFSLQDGQTRNFDGFVPAGAVPEPSTLSLLGTGLLAAGAGLRRRMLRK